MKHLLSNVALLEGVDATFSAQVAARKNIKRDLDAFFRGYDNRFAGMDGGLVEKIQLENELQLAQLIANKIAGHKLKFGEVWPHKADKFELGAVFVNSWGWEQTNIDYYCVVAETEKSVTLLPMTKNVGPEVGFMTNYSVPAEINWAADPILKRKKISKIDKVPHLCFEFGWTDLWDGENEMESHYA